MAASSSDEIWQAHTPAERISVRQCPRGQTDREGCVAKQAPGLAPNWAGFHSWFHNLLSTTSSLPLPRCRRALIHLLLWAERCPPCHPNSYADVLIPSTSDCNFTWGKGYALWFKRGRRVGSACVWLVSFQKGEIWRQAHAENTMWRWSQRPGWCFYRPRNTKDASQAPGGGEGGGRNRVPLTAFRRSQPCQHLDLRPLASRTVMQYISVSSAT